MQLNGLTNLTQLYIWHNNISNISALSGLTNLSYLGVSYNQIINISTLSSLTNLVTLSLNNNLISDIFPLIQNSGINNGDVVDLSDNPLNTISINTNIPQLEARGVTVYNRTGKIRRKIIDDPNYFEIFNEYRKIIK